MKALLSDVHGNLEALRAVLEDVSRHGVEAVYCLGDAVGYGPDPRECLDLAMSWPVVLLGNHEYAVLCGADGFNPVARRALAWTAGQLQAPLPDPEAAQRRRAFRSAMPMQHSEGGLLFVHGSPADPVHDYVFPDEALDGRKMAALFAEVERGCFVGHTHVPGVFTREGFFSPGELGGEYRLGGGKALVNVGSVGQPRDGDPRACYALLDGDTVRFRRVEYDVEATVKKIRGTPELADSLGERLYLGQ